VAGFDFGEYVVCVYAGGAGVSMCLKCVPVGLSASQIYVYLHTCNNYICIYINKCVIYYMYIYVYIFIYLYILVCIYI